MKIGISLLSARPKRTGVENVAFNVLDRLSRIQGEDEYVVFANLANAPWLSDLSGSMRIVDVRFSSRRSLWLWEHLFFLADFRARELDLVHFPIGGGVVGFRGKFVLTIHDLQHYLNKELVKFRRHLLWRIWCKANIKRAAMIITVSEHVKQQILEQFDVAADRVVVIPNGIELGPKSSSDVAVKYSLPERYVLFVGQTAANKNLRRAIDAISLVRNRHNVDHCLVIAGLPGDEDTALKAYVAKKGISSAVKFLGYVDAGDLASLYCNAAVFLFPSLREGFGIPPLEAMRCGVPVVAAHASCMPEVLGNAAIWVEPYSVESIASGITTGLFDEGARRCAIARGLSRASLYTWDKAALHTMAVYHEALSHAIHFEGGALENISSL